MVAQTVRLVFLASLVVLLATSPAHASNTKLRGLSWDLAVGRGTRSVSSLEPFITATIPEWGVSDTLWSRQKHTVRCRGWPPDELPAQ